MRPAPPCAAPGAWRQEPCMHRPEQALESGVQVELRSKGGAVRFWVSEGARTPPSGRSNRYGPSHSGSPSAISLGGILSWYPVLVNRPDSVRNRTRRIQPSRSRLPRILAMACRGCLRGGPPTRWASAACEGEAVSERPLSSVRKREQSEEDAALGVGKVSALDHNPPIDPDRVSALRVQALPGRRRPISARISSQIPSSTSCRRARSVSAARSSSPFPSGQGLPSGRGASPLRGKALSGRVVGAGGVRASPARRHGERRTMMP